MALHCSFGLRRPRDMTRMNNMDPPFCSRWDASLYDHWLLFSFQRALVTTFSTLKQMLLHRYGNRWPGTTSCTAVAAAVVLSWDLNRWICMALKTALMVTVDTTGVDHNERRAIFAFALVVPFIPYVSKAEA